MIGGAVSIQLLFENLLDSFSSDLNDRMKVVDFVLHLTITQEFSKKNK